MVKAALETVLRRDRIVVAAALAGLAALAWGYVLWLVADMNMGGMDMTGFRMIPAGLGIMAPANAPWKAIDRVRVRDVGSDDGWHDGSVCGADDPYVRPRGPPGSG